VIRDCSAGNKAEVGAFGRRRVLAKAITPIGDFVISLRQTNAVRGRVVVGSWFRSAA